jgi:hypothetical protein
MSFNMGALKAQLEANVWYVADSTIIDWNHGTNPNSTKSAVYGAEEGTSSICDSIGNLLFYCSAKFLFSAKHVLLNKDFDLKGDETTTQGALILKHKESSEYFLFTNSGHGDSGGLFLTSWLINGDSVIFTNKAKKILNQTGEGINAVNHQNGRDVWIVTHGYRNNTFYKILLTSKGVGTCISTQYLGPFIGDLNTANNIWISPTGNILGFQANRIDTQYLMKLNTQKAELYSLIPFPNSLDLGIVFSGQGTYFYSWSNFPDKIYRRSIDSWNIMAIQNSRTEVASLTTYNTLRWPRLGYNDYIIFPQFQKSFFTTINNCSEKNVKNISVKDTGFKLLNTKCTRGNFNTNQSYFYTPAINYKYKQDCNTNEFLFWGVDTFAANTYRWEIKKGNSISKYNTKSLNHQFTDTGIWQVKYVATNGSRTDSVSKDIEIFPILKSGFLGKDIGYCGNALPLAVQGPLGMNCYTWQKPHGIETYVDHIAADTAGMYILETCNPVFCTYKDTLLVYEKAEPDAPQISRIGDSLYVTNPEPGVAYHWFKANVFTNSVGPAYKVTDTAWYKVRGVAPINCIGPFDSINVKTLQNRVSLQPSIVFYPNPVMDDVFLQHVPLEAKILLRDVTGRLVYETVAKQSEMQIALTQLPAGNYQLTIETTDQRAVYNVVKL